MVIIYKLVMSWVALQVVCLTNQEVNKVMVRGTSRYQQYFVVEKELRSLDKSSEYVIRKTIQLGGRDIVDCVDINKQPTLSHPLLKNHKIQMTQRVHGIGTENSPTFERESRINSEKKACPLGTVPIPRTTTKDLIMAKTLSRLFNDIEPSRSVHPIEHIVKVSSKRFGDRFRGVNAWASVYNLSVANNQVSTASIWVSNGPADQTNVIMAGWMVAPSINGDSNPRLFIYWTKDTGRTTGCYNLDCPGFVQVSHEVAPKYQLKPASTYGGTTYDLKLQIYKALDTGNWLLSVFADHTVVGYWPKDFFPHLSRGASNVGWGGLAREGNDGISPPMGSGHFPDGQYNHAAYFKFMHYFDQNLQQHYLRNDESEPFVDDTGCYGYQDQTPGKIEREIFLYGGPGGHCGK